MLLYTVGRSHRVLVDTLALEKAAICRFVSLNVHNCVRYCRLNRRYFQWLNVGFLRFGEFGEIGITSSFYVSPAFSNCTFLRLAVYESIDGTHFFGAYAVLESFKELLALGLGHEDRRNH